MPIPAAGAPFARLRRSSVLAPRSTRATSFTRTTDPSGLARTMMFSNSSVRVSRPSVVMVSWSCWRSGVGDDPIRPSAAWMFWLCTAAITSAGARPKAGEAWGVEPQPQRIVERAEQACLADAADARQRIDDVDRGIVVEEQGV